MLLCILNLMELNYSPREVGVLSYISYMGTVVCVVVKGMVFKQFSSGKGIICLVKCLISGMKNLPFKPQ